MTVDQLWEQALPALKSLALEMGVLVSQTRVYVFEDALVFYAELQNTRWVYTATVPRWTHAMRVKL